MESSIIYWIKEVGWNGLLDIGFMSFLIYVVLIWFKKTRAAFILKGMLIILFVYLIARQFNLVMISIVFEKFFGVILITVIVIFQEEIRHFFERVAAWSLNRGFGKQAKNIFANGEVDVLVRTLFDLAREKIGTLIILKGKDVIERHLDGGINLNGVFSAALLKSLFDPHSSGHDGAVIIEGNQVLQFSCHLPLSKNLSAMKDYGTRHAAGLGLSELCDALSLIVSEERGVISVAWEGNLREISEPRELMVFIEEFYQRNKPKHDVHFWKDILKKTSKEKIYAACIAVGLWFVLIYGAEVTYKSFVIPVSTPSLPSSWVVENMDPKELKVTLRGTRRALYLLGTKNIKLNLDVKLRQMEQNIKLHPDNFFIPEDISLENIEPDVLKITLASMDIKK